MTTKAFPANVNQILQAQPIGSSRSMIRSILAVETSEGVGAVVRRSIGTNALKSLNPFLMLDHFKVSKGAGFPDHPHRGQTTVSYMLTGKIQHEDFKGHKGLIGPGDLQWMIAGKGIVHAEMPLFEDENSSEPTGLQLWIDLPKEHKLMEPEYQELKHDQIPFVDLDSHVRIRLISGDSHGLVSPIRHVGGCWFFDIELFRKDSRVFQALPKKWNAFAYILEGQIRFGDSNQGDPGQTSHSVNKFHTVVLSCSDDQDGIEISNGISDRDYARLLLIAGEPLDQPVVQHGPFVMNTQQEIKQAFHDYQMGSNGKSLSRVNFGFENADTWVSSIKSSF